MAFQATSKTFQASKTTQIAMSDDGGTDGGFEHLSTAGLEDQADFSRDEMTIGDSDTVEDFGDDEGQEESGGLSEDSKDSKGVIGGRKELSFEEAGIKKAAPQEPDAEFPTWKSSAE